MQFPDTHYWLKNAHVPRSLIQSSAAFAPANAANIAPQPLRDRENLAWADLEIRDGVIQSVQP
ncbi:hypothetical protein LVR55_29080, partial [Pseudomonas aeruginosa]|uniref:hypothetical protein n=1 Tax=Pseudomonas aeruginosa TaxID=287 RepID=UPI0020955AF1